MLLSKLKKCVFIEQLTHLEGTLTLIDNCGDTQDASREYFEKECKEKKDPKELE